MFNIQAMGGNLKALVFLTTVATLALLMLRGPLYAQAFQGSMTQLHVDLTDLSLADHRLDTLLSRALGSR